MAEFILKHPYPRPPRWMRIDKGAVKWISSPAEADAFPDPEAAMAAFAAARLEMIAKAQIKVDKALAEGKEITPTRWPRTPRNPTIDDMAPDWVSQKGFKPCLESRATENDLLGVIELWFVKTKEGWLGKSKDNEYRVKDTFHEAQPFLSLEAAQAAKQSARYGVQGASYLKGSMAFSQVIPSSGGTMDDQSRGIAAACEAREIGGEIEAAALARMKDLGAAKAQPAKPKARL